MPGTHPSTGCGEPPAVAGLASGSPGDVPLTFDSAGVERHYRLAVPDSYAAKVPASLILNLHGSEANQSDRRRCGLTLRYCHSSVQAGLGWNAKGVIVSGHDPAAHWANPPRPATD